MIRCLHFLLLLVLLLCYQCTAFIPVKINTYAQSKFNLQQSSFDTYSQTDEQELAVDDTIIGMGDTAEVGSFVTIQYTGKLMADDKTFDSGVISFKLGEGQVIPGWEQGVIGRYEGRRKTKIKNTTSFGLW